MKYFLLMVCFALLALASAYPQSNSIVLNFNDEDGDDDNGKDEDKGANEGAKKGFSKKAEGGDVPIGCCSKGFMEALTGLRKVDKNPEAKRICGVIFNPKNAGFIEMASETVEGAKLLTEFGVCLEEAEKDQAKRKICKEKVKEGSIGIVNGAGGKGKEEKK